MKHLKKINESLENTYYSFVEHDNYDNHYLFDSNENACLFLLNIIYNTCKENENKLADIEEMIENMNLEEIFEYYCDLRDEFPHLNQMNYNEVRLMKPRLSDWIKLRIDSKKYNV